MKNILLILLFAFILGCDSKPQKQKGADGYYFEQETFVRTEFPVEIVLVKDQKEMTSILKTKKLPIFGQVQKKDVVAFAIIRVNDPKCTIYMIDPKTKYEPEYIGHELVHCIYGVWHREPQT